MTLEAKGSMASKSSNRKALSAVDAYGDSDLYPTNAVSARPQSDPKPWADRLLADKLSLVKKYYPGGSVLDICCATGEHLMALSPDIETGIGVDFSQRYIDKSVKNMIHYQARNLTFIRGDATALPLKNGVAGLAYCFSSIYQIRDTGSVIRELARVLCPGGIAILDFGNRRSLNTYCLRYYTDWPQTFPITVPEMRAMLRANDLAIEEHRSYQILPLWAGLPRHLWPLLHPAWQELMRRRVAGRMIDEWISSLPGLRQFAFRHVIVCRKTATSSQNTMQEQR